MDIYTINLSVYLFLFFFYWRRNLAERNELEEEVDDIVKRLSIAQNGPPDEHITEEEI